MQAQRILETVLYAENLDDTAAFYERVLQLQPRAREAGRHVFFRCGEGMFLLFNPKNTESHQVIIGSAEVPLHGSHGPGHVAFRMEEAEIPAWRAWLGEQGVHIESEVTWPQGGHSLYFRDPAGNVVELATPRIWGLT